MNEDIKKSVEKDAAEWAAKYKSHILKRGKQKAISFLEEGYNIAISDQAIYFVDCCIKEAKKIFENNKSYIKTTSNLND